MHVIVWQFEVRPEYANEFEDAYGPKGVWVGLFTSGKGYRKTELLKTIDRPHHYVTMDYWESREEAELFRKKHSAEYEALDVKCKRYTRREVCLGAFDSMTES